MLSLVSFSLSFFGIVYAMVKPQPVKLVEFTIAFYCIYSFCCETQCWKDQRQSAAAAAWVAAHENDKVRALTPAWARRWVDVPCSRPAPAPPQPPIVGQTSSVQPSNHMNTLTARTAAPLPCTGPVLRPATYNSI